MRHTFDFVLLMVIMAVGFLGIEVFAYDKAAQIASLVLTVLLYVFWGAYHHNHDGNLTSKVILEYIAIALLVCVILVLFVLRA